MVQAAQRAPASAAASRAGGSGGLRCRAVALTVVAPAGDSRRGRPVNTRATGRRLPPPPPTKVAIGRRYADGGTAVR